MTVEDPASAQRRVTSRAARPPHTDRGQPMLNIQDPAVPTRSASTYVVTQSESKPKPPSAVVITAAAAMAGVLAILIARWWTATGYQPAPVGLPDAGPLTSIGLPVAQFGQRLAGVAV